MTSAIDDDCVAEAHFICAAGETGVGLLNRVVLPIANGTDIVFVLKNILAANRAKIRCRLGFKIMLPKNAHFGPLSDKL